MDKDLCYLVHSPQVLITAEHSATPTMVGAPRSLLGLGVGLGFMG